MFVLYVFIYLRCILLCSERASINTSTLRIGIILFKYYMNVLMYFACNKIYHNLMSRIGVALDLGCILILTAPTNE